MSAPHLDRVRAAQHAAEDAAHVLRLAILRPLAGVPNPDVAPNPDVIELARESLRDALDHLD